MINTVNSGIRELLKSARTIAIVGLSDKPYRTSYLIAETLLDAGYIVIPVNPEIKDWNALTSYPDLASVPVHIDIVNVFRRSQHVSALVEEALAVGAGAVWTQLGVVDYTAAEHALRHGMQVVMDRCISIELSLFS